jgi:hypothetical protein
MPSGQPAAGITATEADGGGPPEARGAADAAGSGGTGLSAARSPGRSAENARTPSATTPSPPSDASTIPAPVFGEGALVRMVGDDVAISSAGAATVLLSASMPERAADAGARV